MKITEYLPVPGVLQAGVCASMKMCVYPHYMFRVSAVRYVCLYQLFGCVWVRDLCAHDGKLTGRGGGGEVMGKVVSG